MAELKELENIIKKARFSYYNPNDSDFEIDDDEYDKMLEKLKKLDPLNKLLTDVGVDESKEFSKSEHIMPMHSQQKARNWKEFIKWSKKEYIVTTAVVNYKLDGMSIELQYINGKFDKAITRGNFETNTGDDITENVKKMKGFELKIEKFNGAVRGEIIMLKSIFEKKYNSYKNPRNIATGLSKRPDGKGSEDLHIYVYDVYPKNVKDRVLFDTEEKKIVFLENNFKYIPVTYICNNIDEIKEVYEEVISERDSLDIDIDGIVIKPNEVDFNDIERKQPMKQIALKFAPVEVISVLLDIEWSFKGSSYCPVAIIEPIEISGSIISKANLSNPGIMKNLGLKIGSIIGVIKCGEIIPKIERVIEIGDGEEIEIPTICKVCEYKLIYTDKKLYCDNDLCKNKLLHQLNKWIKTLNIKNFGKGLVETLYETKTVKRISDLYTLNIEDISDLKRLGGKKLGIKNATKALNNLNSETNISLSKFVAGFDIPNIGEKNVKIIVDYGYNTLEKLRILTVEDLINIKGIGDKKAEFFINGMIDNLEDMNILLSYITIQNTTVMSPHSSNIKVVFTGTLNINRKEATLLVEKSGGKVVNTISKTVTYLVFGNHGEETSKYIKAQDLGIKIINEDEFYSIFQN